MSLATLPLVSVRDGTVRARATIDTADVIELSAHRWRLANGYALRAGGARGKAVYMHREVMGLAVDDPRWVDHINGDRLDNRRRNLRAVEPHMNSHNVPSKAGSSSKYRGVYWCEANSCWNTSVEVRGRFHTAGSFMHELQAAQAIDRLRCALLEGAVPGRLS